MSTRTCVTASGVEAVMSFKDIGEALGMSQSLAFKLYRSGINKLRRMPVNMDNLGALADQLEHGRCSEHRLRREANKGGAQ